MAGNTKLVTSLAGGATTKYQYISYRIISDGSQETAAVVYDNSAIGPNSVTKGAVMGIKFSGKCSGTCRLEWDQTTKSPIATLGPGNVGTLKFEEMGGIKNPGATGATGDIVITTVGLASGDEFTIFLKIKQQ